MYVVDDDDTNNNDDEVEKTLAIIIGLIAAVALIIVFVSFLNKLCEGGKGIYIYATPLLLHHFSPSYSFPYLTSFLVFLLQVASKLQFLDITSVCSGK
jgi:hypothetical protein